MEGQAPPYAILSHTWGNDEVTYEDIRGILKPRRMTGWTKIKYSAEQALQDRLDFLWVDTCCIDKTSSSELQEAINSMYQWYQSSVKCYAYLSDVSSCPYLMDETMHDSLDLQEWGRHVAASRWFTRGWTLQELIAPKHVEFYGREWTLVGSKDRLAKTLSEITQIDFEVLTGRVQVSSMSVAKRMCWAARRQTSRVEDRAYSLLGIFDVNMPLLYGEGAKAFRRLQEEIIKISVDHSIFVWDTIGELHSGALLAPSPENFAHANKVVRVGEPEAFEMTNKGLNMNLLIITQQQAPDYDISHDRVRSASQIAGGVSSQTDSGQAPDGTVKERAETTNATAPPTDGAHFVSDRTTHVESRRRSNSGDGHELRVENPESQDQPDATGAKGERKDRGEGRPHTQSSSEVYAVLNCRYQTDLSGILALRLQRYEVGNDYHAVLGPNDWKSLDAMWTHQSSSRTVFLAREQVMTRSSRASLNITRTFEHRSSHVTFWVRSRLNQTKLTTVLPSYTGHTMTDEFVTVNAEEQPLAFLVYQGLSREEFVIGFGFDAEESVQSDSFVTYVAANIGPLQTEELSQPITWMRRNNIVPGQPKTMRGQDYNLLVVTSSKGDLMGEAVRTVWIEICPLVEVQDVNVVKVFHERLGD